MTVTISHWSAGKPFEGAPQGFAPVTNPATGQVTGQVALASPADAQHVIDQAAAAAPAWAALSVAKRTQVMFAFRGC
ncbi:aldehyde dehydrogenase family protein [Aeromicrobium sp. UC242_57]|uniref:aldehyde dehydrogenase family protein n=1 Tax=Aeromicrobium sp. UC242_57 TaxID=3374624 RepID=UPI0037958871